MTQNQGIRLIILSLTVEISAGYDCTLSFGCISLVKYTASYNTVCSYNTYVILLRIGYYYLTIGLTCNFCAFGVFEYDFVVISNAPLIGSLTNLVFVRE